MDKAICIGDVNDAAFRSLIGFRTLSKPGLAVNSTTNTYTLTLGGTKQTDDIISVTVAVDGAAETATYTTLVGNANLDAVATALEVQIEALTGVTSSVSGSVITITPTTTTQAIVVTAAVTKAVGDPTTTATVAQTIVGSKGIKTENTFQFVIDGHAGEQTTQTNVALSGIDVIPVSSFCWWLVSIGTTGVVTATQGTVGQNMLPAIPANQAPIGAVKIATDGTHTFTPGVTGLNSTGITDTYFDLSCVPKAGYPA